MFIFNASHNAFIPVLLMLLSFHLLKTEKKSGLFMDTICVLFPFVLTSQIKFCECCACFQCIIQ